MITDMRRGLSHRGDAAVQGNVTLAIHCEERTRPTTPNEGGGNMRKLHKVHVPNPAEHTCQCEQDVAPCASAVEPQTRGGNVKRASVRVQFRRNVERLESFIRNHRLLMMKRIIFFLFRYFF